MKNFFKISRIENLTDGVYAIAMTLLVLNLNVPNLVGPDKEAALWESLVRSLPRLFNFAISFYILAQLWISHNRQFVRIQKVEERYLWVNLVGLFFICLVPFTTDLVGDYSSLKPADLVFHAHMLCIGLVFWYQSHMALDRELLEAGKGLRQELRLIQRGAWALPMAAFLGFALTWVIPGWSCMCYFFIPFFARLLKGDADESGQDAG